MGYLRRACARGLMALGLTVIAAAISSTQTQTARNPEFACAACHRSESASQSATIMAHAAARGADAQILRDHPDMRVTRGAYTFAIHREANRVTYSVSDGVKTFSAPITWAFGSGSIGQTYLYEYRGDLYESQVSYYSPLNGLDITLGHFRANPANVEEAAGWRLTKAGAERCFECHTTVHTGALVAGVLCERCHTNALQHAQTIGSENARRVIPQNLAFLTNDAVSDMCGSCHRTYREIVTNGTMNLDNVRSAPYRLVTSKCYESSKDDKRISCVGCHDPHQELAKTPDYYDSKCLGCHATSGSPAPVKGCPVANSDCVSCHMPTVNFPHQHSRFTDHRIRIVVAGAPYPI